MSESKTISKGLNTTFLVHLIVGVITGLFVILAPETYITTFDYTGNEPMLLRLVGAATLAFAISSWLGYKETNFDNVRIIVIVEIAWTVLGAIIFIWGIIDGEFPDWAWMNVIMFLAFAGAFWYFSFYEKKETPAE